MATRKDTPPEGNATPTPHVPYHPAAGTGPLAARIARIAGSVGRLVEDGRVTGTRGFSYATVDAMAGALTPRLMDEGVAIYPVSIRVIDSHPFQLDGDKYGWRWLTSIEVGWNVTDGEETWTIPSLGKSVDSNGSEKDTNQAETFARINLYKTLFHLAAGEDPEQKGTPRAAQNGSTGEVPDVSNATVEGRVVILGEGTVGLAYSINPRDVQAEINGLVRGLGGQWQKDGKLYAIPTENTAGAVALARAIGLAIPEKVAERFPAPAPPAEPSGDGSGDGSGEGDLPVSTTQSDADREAAEAAGDAAFGGQGTLGDTAHNPPD